ncbi:hypothetical protein ACFL7E_06945 [Thermodesulfobacteriota bacterium]
MNNPLKRFLFLLILISIAGVVGLGVSFASDKTAKKDMGGWEMDGAYNRLFNANDMERLKGYIKSFKEVVPMPGMAPGVAFVLHEKYDDEDILVHLCPAWYMDENKTGLKKGDEVKIRGAWIEIGDDDVFVATKIKRGENFVLKVRLSKDGKPFWTMDPYELAKEKAAIE